MGAERTRGSLLRERESSLKIGPVFGLVVVVVVVVAWSSSGSRGVVRPVPKKLLFAINFSLFEAHLSRVLFGGGPKERQINKTHHYQMAFSFCRQAAPKFDLGKNTRARKSAK